MAEVLSELVEWAPGEYVTARLSRADSQRSILMAHGAGTDQDHQSIQAIRDGFLAQGHTVATFNYPHKEGGSGRPDRVPKLIECHGAMLRWARTRMGPDVVMAGRSMGGRMATMLAAQRGLGPSDCTGIILFSYPLHPASKPEKLRVEHLPAVKVPMLFLTGTRDALCDLPLLDEHVRPLSRATVHLIDDGDHSMKVRLKSGRNTAAAHREMMQAANDWLE